MDMILTENINVKDFENAVKPLMDKEIKLFEKELTTIRTGRAHTSMIEDLTVPVYGSTMKLKELAALSVPEARIIIIQAWDKSILPNIEKAIMSSDLGFVPINDGNIIRIQLPEISSERREELIKILRQKLEKAKVAIRYARKEAHNLIRDAERTKKISEDFSKRLNDSLQKITDKYIAKLDDLNLKKEKEIRII